MIEFFLGCAIGIIVIGFGLISSLNDDNNRWRWKNTRGGSF